jgi:hypothetical protein
LKTCHDAVLHRSDRGAELPYDFLPIDTLLIFNDLKDGEAMRTFSTSGFPARWKA